MGLKARNRLTLNNFKGVDFSSSVLAADPRRAVRAVNVICEDGINRKRNGWREVFKIEDENHAPMRINGIFKFNDFFIVHAGVRIFKAFPASEKYAYIDVTESSTHALSAVDPNVLQDTKSQGFIMGGRLYLVGLGDFLVYGSWDDGKTFELRRVENGEDTYIPTTTININCDAQAEDDIRATLEAPNLLSCKRINALVGASSGATWTLDAEEIEPKSEVRVRVESIDENGRLIETVYANGYEQVGKDPITGDSSLYLYSNAPYEEDASVKAYGTVDFAHGKITLDFDTELVDNDDNVYVTFEPRREPEKTRVVYATGQFYDTVSHYSAAVGGYVPTYKPYTIAVLGAVEQDSVIVLEADRAWYKKDKGKLIVLKNEYKIITAEGIEQTVYGGSEIFDSTIYERDAIPKAVGSINFETGEIILWYDLDNRDDRKNNVKITYTVSGAEGGDAEEITSAAINNSRFGSLFGANGNSDRLFLAGGGEFKNVDFYSASEDFTYFTAEQNAVLGSEETAIGGYVRLSDSTLAILKAGAVNEPAIHYRTSDTRSDKVVFPLSAGGGGEVIVSPFACANFLGDPLFLSANGVFGIELGGNVATTERYSRYRSKLINKKLCEHDRGVLGDAAAVVFKDRYYLSLDGECYVADARYKYASEGEAYSSFNYEWWYFDNIPARVWAVMDEALYFGTAKGQVCVFDGEYTDRSYYNVDRGEIGFNVSSGKITCAERVSGSFFDGDRIAFNSGDVYALYCDGVTVQDGVVQVSEQESLRLFDGMELYADCVGESGLEVGIPYTVADSDFGECTFKLLHSGVPIEIKSGGFRLSRKVSGHGLLVCEKDGTSFKVRIEGDELPLIIAAYDGVPPSNIGAGVINAKSITAEWQTPVFDLGSPCAVKTILGMTVTADPRYSGKLKFGLSAKYSADEFMLKGRGAFVFDDLSFNEFSFDTAFASSYTVRLNSRNVNYVSFYLRSDDDKGCAMHEMSVLYKINKNIRGIN